MSVYSVVLIFCLFLFFAYSLFKTLGKNIGLGSSSQERDTLRETARAAKKAEVCEDEKSQSEKINSPKTHGNPAIIRLSDLQISEQDKEVLKRIDKNSLVHSSQELVDGFYMFGQKLIESQLEKMRECKLGIGSSDKDLRQIMEKAMQSQEAWFNYFSSLLQKSKDVDFLIFKLLGLRNIELKQNEDHASFWVDTLCVFNLYEKPHEERTVVNEQVRSQFSWKVVKNVSSRVSSLWEVVDFSVQPA